MLCGICWRDMGNEPPPCPYCGQTSAVPPVRSTRLDEHLEELQLQGSRKELDAKDRRRRRFRSHAVTGVITFFILNLLVGLPQSLKLLNLLINLGASVLLGAPLGMLISRCGGGQWRGGLISMGVFMLLRLILAIPGLVQGGALFEIAAGALMLGLLGFIPGAIIGIHVEADD